MDELIDEIFIEIPKSIGLTVENEAVGVYHLATLLLSYTLVCSEGYYGSNCSTFCVPHNDTNGHYDCNQVTGEKVCLSGYQNPDSNCTECEYACQRNSICYDTMLIHSFFVSLYLAQMLVSV